MTGLRMFTIYDHPRDFPGGFVVREWDVTGAKIMPLTAWTAPTLEAARELVPPGLVCMADGADDPVIVETWL